MHTYACIRKADDSVWFLAILSPSDFCQEGMHKTVRHDRTVPGEHCESSNGVCGLPVFIISSLFLIYCQKHPFYGEEVTFVWVTSWRLWTSTPGRIPGKVIKRDPSVEYSKALACNISQWEINYSTRLYCMASTNRPKCVVFSPDKRRHATAFMHHHSKEIAKLLGSTCVCTPRDWSGKISMK